MVPPVQDRLQVPCGGLVNHVGEGAAAVAISTGLAVVLADAGAANDKSPKTESREPTTVRAKLFFICFLVRNLRGTIPARQIIARCKYVLAPRYGSWDRRP